MINAKEFNTILWDLGDETQGWYGLRTLLRELHERTLRQEFKIEELEERIRDLEFERDGGN